MYFELTERSFGRVMHDGYPEAMPRRLVQEASAIGPYADAYDKPGSSFLWLGDQHRLNREQVADLVVYLSNWLQTGRLDTKADKAADQPENSEPKTKSLAGVTSVSVDLNVTQYCIILGMRNSCERCPVALAAALALVDYDEFSNLIDHTDISVGDYKLVVTDRHGRSWGTSLPTNILNFIQDFDSCHPVKPLRATIQLTLLDPESDPAGV